MKHGTRHMLMIPDENLPACLASEICEQICTKLGIRLIDKVQGLQKDNQWTGPHLKHKCYDWLVFSNREGE